MQTTMKLLNEALELDGNIANWTKRLQLSQKALYNAQAREHLSPAIAGSLADELGKDPMPWIVAAALESERDSKCKTRMLKRTQHIVRALYLATRATANKVRRIRTNNAINRAFRRA